MVTVAPSGNQQSHHTVSHFHSLALHLSSHSPPGEHSLLYGTPAGPSSHLQTSTAPQHTDVPWESNTQYKGLTLPYSNPEQLPSSSSDPNPGDTHNPSLSLSSPKLSASLASPIISPFERCFPTTIPLCLIPATSPPLCSFHPTRYYCQQEGRVRKSQMKSVSLKRSELARHGISQHHLYHPERKLASNTTNIHTRLHKTPCCPN